MPELYQGTQFDTAGFSVGFLSPEEFLHPSRMTAHQEVWGWKSTGPHSNGFSLLRKLFNPKTDADVIETLMAPTKIYVQEFCQLRRYAKENVKAAFHITGSGLLNLLRGQTELGFVLDCWPDPLPHWFLTVEAKSKMARELMFKTFNGGIGFVVVAESGSITSQMAAEHNLLRIGTTDSSGKVKFPQYGIEFD